jgi:hypothetical protein
MIINTDWLCDVAGGKRPDLGLANGRSKAVIVVPPMAEFLDETIAYFRAFIDAALKVPDRVRTFMSEHAAVRC